MNAFMYVEQSLNCDSSACAVLKSIEASPISPRAFLDYDQVQRFISLKKPYLFKFRANSQCTKVIHWKKQSKQNQGRKTKIKAEKKWHKQYGYIYIYIDKPRN